MANIVLIEDSRPITFLIEAILETQHRVSVYGDGEQGLAALRSAPPDLLILDVGLPDVSGFELATQIRREISLADLPILMLTALGDVDSRVRGLQVADDYLTKPFDKHELLARVGALLRRKHDIGGVRGRLELLGGAGAAVQMVALLHPQGALVFDDGVVIYFAQGRIIDVHHPLSLQDTNNTNNTNHTNNTMPTAVLKLLADTFSRSEGGFRFEPQATLPQATLDLDPMAILLEAARIRDEAQRDQQASAATPRIDLMARDITVVPDFSIAESYLEHLKGRQRFGVSQALDQDNAPCVLIMGEVLTLAVPKRRLAELPTSLAWLLEN